MAAWRAGAVLGLLGAVPALAITAPTYCAEWVRQSSEGYERLTLFTDRTLIWKTRRGESEDVKRKGLDAEEAKFYCDYFARPEFWTLPEDQRSRLTGEFVNQSVLRLAKPDGSIKEIRFDELSPSSSESAALRSSLEGLKRSFLERFAPASKFTVRSLPAGTVLKRFDGALFRVLRVDEGKGVVELEGVSEPFTLFRRIDELRFFFEPPEE